MKGISNKFRQGALTIIILFVIFAGIALKSEKRRPKFSKFQFMAILVIRCNRRHWKQCHDSNI